MSEKETNFYWNLISHANCNLDVSRTLIASEIAALCWRASGLIEVSEAGIYEGYNRLWISHPFTSEVILLIGSEVDCFEETMNDLKNHWNGE